jgi:hypothetical protein
VQATKCRVEVRKGEGSLMALHTTLALSAQLIFPVSSGRRTLWPKRRFNQSGELCVTLINSPDMKRATSRCPFPSGVLSYISRSSACSRACDRLFMDSSYDSGTAFSGTDCPS